MYPSRGTPQAIAHRGLHAHFPENSLPAFEAAVASGADAIELDVHATADRTLVVHHDPILAGSAVPGAGAGGTAAIATLSARQIAETRLAPGIGIPALREVLAKLPIETFLYIEVKVPGIEQLVAEIVAGVPGRTVRCAVHSFDHRVVRRIGELLPGARTGILQVCYPVDQLAVLRAAGAADLWQQWELVDHELVEAVHGAGGRVIAWTANDERAWESLSAAGVYGICTDRVGDYVTWAGR